MNVKDFIKKSYIRPWDVIIIVVLAVGSFLPLVVFSMQDTESITKQAV